MQHLFRQKYECSVDHVFDVATHVATTCIAFSDSYTAEGTQCFFYRTTGRAKHDNEQVGQTKPNQSRRDCQTNGAISVLNGDGTHIDDGSGHSLLGVLDEPETLVLEEAIKGGGGEGGVRETPSTEPNTKKN